MCVCVGGGVTVHHALCSADVSISPFQQQAKLQSDKGMWRAQ